MTRRDLLDLPFVETFWKAICSAFGTSYVNSSREK